MTDLTKITTPYGLLDEKTKLTLPLHGGPYEYFSSSGSWHTIHPPSWANNITYRVKPTPPKPREWVLVNGTDFYGLDLIEAVNHPGCATPICRVREVIE